MGYLELQIQLAPDYFDDEIRSYIHKKLNITAFSYTIERKSLDARNKRNIHWLIRVGVSSPDLKTGEKPSVEKLKITQINKKKNVVVVGSGPAGIFAALTLQLSGFNTTIVEMGKDVDQRAKDIASFEKTGHMIPLSNYAFGEGGAGTFSDGKLTSRTKSISKEKAFIIDTLISCGAPEEIQYLTHPHVGSDNLKIVVKNLRKQFLEQGGEIHFDTQMTNLKFSSTHCTSARVTNTISKKTFEIPLDYIVIAPGHSSFNTYRMLIQHKIPFRTKPFALGFRVEHLQEDINKSQWNAPAVGGLKAAEYRLTRKSKTKKPVYSFCMCPGGKIVPASTEPGELIVNGMSNYKRNSSFANSAIVAGMHIDRILNKTCTPLEVLSWLKNLEKSFYTDTGSYKAPANKITDFIHNKISSHLPDTSYPFGIYSADFRTLLPSQIIPDLQDGLQNFCRKLKYFDQGIIVGLESKTSSPIQVIRDKAGKVEGFSNLYVSGEGSGYAGGIISSAADGMKAALDITSKEI